MKMKKSTIIGALIVSAVPFISMSPAFADFPDGDIDFIAPASVGGGSDYLIRSLQPALEENLDVSVVPRYLAGGGGAIGFMKAANSRPDGQTVVAIDNKIFTQQGLGNVPLKYTDFDYLASLYSVPYVLALSSDLEIDDLESFLADENNQDLRIAYAGTGSSTNIMAILISQKLGVDYQKVSYPGAPEAVAAVMGGHIDGMVMDPMDLRGALESGDVTPILVTSGERSDALPDVPTMKEKGYDVDISNWRGVAAPAGLDEDTKARWVEALRVASEDPRFVKRIEDLGLEVNFQAGPSFDEYVENLSESVIPVAESVANDS